MNLYVDRDLPVPLGVQVRGMIEYGIACGEFAPGERLPSVRELADSLKVAPMTVSQVYGELREAGLIETRRGSGTFVAENGAPQLRPDERLADVQRRLDLLIDEALAIGLRPADFAGMVQSRLFRMNGRERRRRVVMVGVFAEATRAYARAIEARLGADVVVEPITLDMLKEDGSARHRAAAAELIVTLANRRREVVELLPGARVATVRFIPSEETRRALAGLDPLTRLGVISRFPDFLPIMKPGVQRFAPHVRMVLAAVVDTPAFEAVIARSDVVVVSTGAESVLDRLRPGTRAIEYRHTPDPGDVDRVIAPLLVREGGPITEQRKALP
jgi:DNA-binding transcriptional regulator YhcF (GntR family)